jgi:hypothetical protein
MPILAQAALARAPLAGFAAMGVIWGCYAAVFPDLKAMLGVDEGQMGLLIFAAPVAAVTAMLLAPAYGARLGRVALPLACMAMAAVLVLPGQAASLVLFPLAMMACGAATGLSDVLLNARVVALEAARGQPLLNLGHAAYSFGYAASAMATGALRAADLPPGTVTGTMALVALAFALATWEREGAIEGLVRDRGLPPVTLGWVPLVGGLIVLIAFLTENAVENWSALHIEKTLGGSPAEGAAAPAILALIMGFARLAGQGLANRADPVRIIGGGALVAAAGALIAAGAASPGMAYAGFIVMGLGASVVAPMAYTLVGRHAPPELRARAVARTTVLGYGGYFLGPPILGLVAGLFGLRMAFVFAAVVLGLVPVLAPMVARIGAAQAAKAAA